MPVIEAVNVLILFNTPFNRHISHSDFLALVHKRRAPLERQSCGQHLGCNQAVLFFGTRIAIDRPWLIVVLPVQSVPTAIVVHEGLPPVKERLEIRELPTARLELVVRAVVNVDVLKVEDHVDFVAVKANGLQHLVRVLDKGHLADTERIVFLEDLAQSLQVFMQPRSVGIVFVRPLPNAPSVLDRGVREPLVLADKVDDVHSESICSLVQPKAHDIVDGVADRWVLPVEIGLLGGI